MTPTKTLRPFPPSASSYILMYSPKTDKKKQVSRQKEKQKNQKRFVCAQKATMTKTARVVRLALFHLCDNEAVKHQYE